MPKKGLIIIPSIRRTDNFQKWFINVDKFKHKVDFLFLNEKNENNNCIYDAYDEAQKRSVNFTPLNILIFGESCRKEWFNRVIEVNVGVKYEDVIPPKSHDELSFGLLWALTKKYDYVYFLDDDVEPLENIDYLLAYKTRLFGCTNFYRKNSMNNWVNTHPTCYARGFPYSKRGKDKPYKIFSEIIRKPVLHMGTWVGVPDLNAYDYLTNTKKFLYADFDYDFDEYAIPPKTYAPICSMNVAFKTEIIPAFYQLYDNNRFNDIFSGIYLKRIADHLHANLTVGYPPVNHVKAPRNIFSDVKRELQSLELNEVLSEKVDACQLYGNDWSSCYKELALELYTKFRESQFESYVYDMTRRMFTWSQICDYLTHNKLNAR